MIDTGIDVGSTADYIPHPDFINAGIALGGDISLNPLGFWGTWVPMPTEYVPMHDAGWEPNEADYQYHFGTSVACPLVAGLAALGRFAAPLGSDIPTNFP